MFLSHSSWPSRRPPPRRFLPWRFCWTGGMGWPWAPNALSTSPAIVGICGWRGRCRSPAFPHPIRSDGFFVGITYRRVTEVSVAPIRVSLSAMRPILRDLTLDPGFHCARSLWRAGGQSEPGFRSSSTSYVEILRSSQMNSCTTNKTDFHHIQLRRRSELTTLGIDYQDVS